MNLFSKKPTVTRLEALQNQSASAVSLIRSTIDQLKATNEAIDQEHASNESKIVALSVTNTSLDTLKHDNEKVIANFENLLS
jgi:FtsZ-binding cell division protein ZapB